LFEPNGLHKIPYLTTLPTGVPLPVYDGETWPDTEEALSKALRNMDTAGQDVIDISTHSAARETVEREGRMVRPNDAHMGAMKALLEAIKHPEELRLLPHIVREWRRQGLKMTKVNTLRLVQLASSFDDLETIFYMGNPETFGIYLHLETVREIVRAMARRAIQNLDESEPAKEPAEEAAAEANTDATTESSDKSSAKLNTKSERIASTPLKFLQAIPELLSFSMNVTPRDLFKDPFLAGTQLWVFMYRFLSDDKYRNVESVMDLTQFAENLVQGMSGMEIGPPRSSFQTDKDYALALRDQVVGYLPLLAALRRYSEIIQATYLACQTAFNSVEAKDSPIARTKMTLDLFLKNGLFTTDDSEKFMCMEINMSAGNQWSQLNEGLRKELEVTDGTLRLCGLSDWQLALLERFVNGSGPSTQGRAVEPDSTPSVDYNEHYLPLYIQAAYGILERRMAEWRKIMGRYGQVISKEFDLKPLLSDGTQ
jgi:hypothetical protein